MRQAPHRAAPTSAMLHVWAVWVAQPIRKSVVLAMVRNPGDHGPLDRGRTEDGQYRPDPRCRLECAMREQAMKANGDAETRRHVQDQKREDVAPAQHAGPELPGDEEEADD